ncbi:MAG: phosphotyrosine protein phosphatase [Pseudomonadota bacterium]
MRTLFVCGKARMRSPTAADVAATFPNVESDFAGVSGDAEERVSLDQVDWADVIFVMETVHKRKLTAQFGSALRGKRIVVLSIPDMYAYGDPDLIARLQPLLKSHLN